VGARIHGWLQEPPAIGEPDPTRRGFLSLADVRAALDADPTWERLPHGDLQVHTTDSDGRLPLHEAAGLARALGRPYVGITDHSKSLQIAHGMDEQRLAEQVARIDALNEELREAGDDFRVLRSMEMDVFADGSGDMGLEALAPLDLVLGAFHSKLRSRDDETERYLRLARNPLVHVVAHPTTRMFSRRAGLTADWPRVFGALAEAGKAVEIDGSPARQDLPVDLARIALAEGVEWFSMGSDAHSVQELSYLRMSLAIASIAGIPRERFLNFRTADEVVGWAAALTERASQRS